MDTLKVRTKSDVNCTAHYVLLKRWIWKITNEKSIKSRWRGEVGDAMWCDVLTMKWRGRRRRWFFFHFSSDDGDDDDDNEKKMVCHVFIGSLFISRMNPFSPCSFFFFFLFDVKSQYITVLECVVSTSSTEIFFY